MKAYEHTQVGTLTLTVLAVVAAFLIGVSAMVWGSEPGDTVVTVGGSVLFVLALIAAVFSTLRVVVDGQAVEVGFGPVRAIRRRIALLEVASVGEVRNKWWYGWGIRLTPHGWLWNVSGLEAVELTFHSGRKFRIGTDEPEALCAAIQAQMSLSRA